MLLCDRAGQKLQAMDEDKCSLELLPLEIQLIVVGKLGWTELATLACASKHFLHLVRHCTHKLGLGLANHVHHAPTFS